MKTVDILVDKIKPYKRNAKKHPPEQIEKLSRNIKKYGFTQPLVIDDSNTIIIGHGRFEAAKKLNMSHVPCVKLEGLSKTEVKAMRLFDNKISETGWDESLLKLELTDLLDEKFDLSLTGFDDFVLEEFDEDDEEDFVEEAPTQPASSTSQNGTQEQRSIVEPKETDNAKPPATRDATGSKEYTAEQFDGFQHRCPRCQFEWND